MEDFVSLRGVLRKGQPIMRRKFLSSLYNRLLRKGINMKAILLDMYGVILKQTGDEFVPYVQRTFPKLTPEEIYIPWYKGNIGEWSSLKVWEALGYQGDLEEIEKEYLDTIELNDGFIDFIEIVRKDYKLAIISNDASRWSRYLRDKFNINQYFDVISISADLKLQKPDERIFQYTIDKLNVSADECLYVDDRKENLNTAQKMGMKTVMLNSLNTSDTGSAVKSFNDLITKIKGYS